MSATPEDLKAMVAAMLARQGLMTTIGARLVHVASGEVEIELPVSPHISQQNGYVHAGAVSAIADTACGTAAWTLMAEGANVLTVEFKINLLAPAAGERIIASARVIKPGRTLTFTEAQVHAIQGEEKKLIAHLTATMMTIMG